MKINWMSVALFVAGVVLADRVRSLPMLSKLPTI